MKGRKVIERELAGLRDLTTAKLAARYEELHGKPPRIRHREWQIKRIAWKLQERVYGGLSATAQARLEELISEMNLPLDEDRRTVSGRLKKPRAKPGTPAPGTELVRQWRGQEIRVQVREDGFEYQAEVYRSLSAVARAITGAKWNGRLFFGLAERKKAS